MRRRVSKMNPHAARHVVPQGDVNARAVNVNHAKCMKQYVLNAVLLPKSLLNLETIVLFIVVIASTQEKNKNSIIYMAMMPGISSGHHSVYRTEGLRLTFFDS
jgi:hypothetical protein